MVYKRWGHLCLLFLVLFFLAISKKAETAILLNTSLSYSEVYNDNYNFSATDRKTDFGSYLQPSLKLTYQSKNVTLSGNYVGSLEYHVPQNFGQFSQRGFFDIKFPFLNRMIKGVQVNISEDVIYTPDLPAFTFADKPRVLVNKGPGVGGLGLSPGLQQPRGDTLRNLFRLSLGLNHSPRLRTNVSYTNRYSNFEREDLNDSLEHGGSLGIRFDLTAKTNLSTSYGYSTTSFEGGGNIEIHRISAGISHRRTPLLSFGGSAGTTMVPNAKPRFTFNMNITRILKNGRISLGYSNNVVTGGGFTTGATIRQLITINASHSLGKKLSGYWRFGYGDHRSIEGGALDLTTYTGETGFILSILSWLESRLKYSHVNQVSNGTVGQDGHRNSVSIVFSAKGPSWRFFK
jgi:hypothetical protein